MAVFNLPVIGLHYILEKPMLDLSKLKFLRIMKQIIKNQRTVHNSLLLLYSLYHHARVKLTFTMKFYYFIYYHSRLEILHIQCHDAAPSSAWKLTVKQQNQLKHTLISIFFLHFRKLSSIRKIFLDTPEKLVEKNAVVQKLDKTKNALKAQLRTKLKWVPVLFVLQLFQTRGWSKDQPDYTVPVCHCTWQKLAAHWIDSRKSKTRGIYNFTVAALMLFNSRGFPSSSCLQITEDSCAGQCTSRSGGSNTGLFTTICGVCTDQSWARRLFWQGWTSVSPGVRAIPYFTWKFS